MYVHKHANPAHLHITRVNTSQLTWTCPRHVLGPHNSVVFTGSAGPSRQAGKQTVSLNTHLCCLPGEMTPTLPWGYTMWRVNTIQLDLTSVASC